MLKAFGFGLCLFLSAQFACATEADDQQFFQCLSNWTGCPTGCFENDPPQQKVPGQETVSYACYYNANPTGGCAAYSCTRSVDVDQPYHGQGPLCAQVKRNSIVSVDDQVIGEAIPVTGTPFSLYYFSNRVIGRQRDYHIRIPLSNTSLKSDALSLHWIGGSVSYSPTSNTNYDFVWDGKDSSGNLIEGGSPLNYTILEDHPTSGFSGSVNYTGYLGGRKAVLSGLGGWTLSIHHFYDINLKTIYFGTGSYRKVTATLLSSGNYQAPNDDGSEVYIFNSNGKHLTTLYGLTGNIKYSFNYNSLGFLNSVTDAFSNVTTINRSSSGNITGIQSADGQLTSIALDSNGYLYQATNPNLETYTATYYGTQGLLHTFQNPRGVTGTFIYDSDGNLLGDSSSGGPSLTLSSILSAYNSQVAVTTAEGIVTSVSNSDLLTNQDSTHTNASGGYESLSVWPGNQTTYSGFGYGTTNVFKDDIRFPGQAQFSGSFSETHGSKTVTYVGSQSLAYNNPSAPSPFDVASLSSTVTQSDGTSAFIWQSAYSGSTKTFTYTSPLSRVRSRTINSNEQRTAEQLATLSPISYGYDTRGRISSVSQGTRTTSFAYNSAGWLSSVTNPLSQVTSFTYDLAGRALTQTLPDLRVIGYTYDSNGNLTSITPPSSSVHQFSFNLMDLPSGYLSPSLGSGTLNTLYSYNNDRKLTSVTRPNGAIINYSYDSTTGLLDSVTSGSMSFSFGYDSAERMTSSSSPDGINTYYSFGSGDQMVSVSDGTIANQSVTYGYNSFARLGSFQIGGGTTYSFLYDNDGLLKQTGAEALNRSSTTGFVTDTSLSNAKEYYTYDSTYGELASYQAKYTTSTNKILESYTRDGNGRIATRTVTIGTASPDVYAYTYDASGRLTDVTKNSSSIGHYVYDANSNRTSSTNSAGTFSATYDAEDRLSIYGTKTFAYNLNGERTSQVDSSTSPTTTNYTWDAFGNLKQVTLPAGTQIKYQYDGQNRKVTKLTGSTVNERYVYLDQTRILGVLNSSGSTVMTFFYGERNTPEYMIKSGTTYKFFVDHVGSVRQVINTSTGAVSQEITYDEFGRVLTDSSPGFQPFGFAGGLYDSATGLTEFGARWYDAEVGRWLSKDPLGFGGGSSNFYDYAQNDPVNNIDPTGLKTTVITTYDYGVGSHSAILVETPGQPSFLYDPAGSYPGKGSGDFLSGVSLSQYITHQVNTGSRVETAVLNTTPAQEAAIMNRAMDQGGPIGGLCATYASGALGGVCGISGSMFPGRLNNQARQSSCPAK